MTDLDIYQQPAAPGGYQPAMVMTPDQARELDAQVRRCTEAVLREGTDYGVIPGTSGEKTLWRPGAQKLLQWFGLGYSCDRVEVERDDAGRKHGITYRATVAQRLPDGTLFVKATCEGTADYDESKFYQTAEQVKARLREQEHKWAAKDRRVPNADRWNSAREYRADWNALMKRAQKRAIVGAVVDATAAGGIFADREEDDSAAPQDDGPGWYEQALEAAFSFTTKQAGDELYVNAAQAYAHGQCTGKQKDHVQNAVRKRQAKLRNVKVVDVEELAGQAASAAADADEPAEDQPPRIQAARPQLLSVIAQHFDRLGITERDERLSWTSKLAGRDLASSKELTPDEARDVAGQLWKCENLGDLTALLADGEKPGGDNDG